MVATYREFLESKITVADRHGFDISDMDLQRDLLKPHQRDVIRWAASNGRALLALRFGLGKTRIQCELARIIHLHTGKRFLVVCPLGVKHQFIHEDGPVMGTSWKYCRTDEEIRNAGTPYIITNYERVRDGDITPELHDFAGVSLDEGSVLRSRGSKTYQVYIDLLKSVPYRFVATATPDPNEFKELIYFADFLGIMDSGQALTRFFKRDSTKAGHLTVHPLHEKEFWMWVSTWALFLFSPSDLGYSDEGYSLPALNVHWHRIKVDHTRAFDQTDNRGQHRLLLDPAAGVKEATAEKRATLSDRIETMQAILADHPDRHWLLWHHQEAERKAIEKAVPQSLSVFGSQDLEVREERILKFSHGEIPILASKPELSGSGCNFQYYCHSNIFLGVDYRFEDFIQAIHRTYRFLQAKPVDVHIIYAESEDHVVETLMRKWTQYDKQTQEMREIVRKFGLATNAIQSALSRSIGVLRMETKEKLFTAVNNDCVLELDNLPNDHVGLIHTSIPFGNHYEYTAQYEDFGHNSTDGDFWKQMDYLVPKLLRVLKPGRVAAIHVKDRILYGHQTKSGYMEVAEFSDDCVKAFKKHGFLYEGRRTIVTDVVRENASTYRLGYSEMTIDASKMGSGLPEYLLLFRKPPTSNKTSRADEPVTKDKGNYSRARWQIDASSDWESNGNTPLLPHELYDYEEHVARLEQLDRKGALPAGFSAEPLPQRHPMVWRDVIYMRTLNSEQSKKKLENHICPLPFDIVERTIRLYSNEGDLVLDPFMGLGTVPMIAMKLDRIGYGIELNNEYFQAALKHLERMQQEKLMPTLFDYLEAVKAEEPQ